VHAHLDRQERRLKRRGGHSPRKQKANDSDSAFYLILRPPASAARTDRARLTMDILRGLFALLAVQAALCKITAAPIRIAG
jgi:hypothetical protein